MLFCGSAIFASLIFRPSQVPERVEEKPPSLHRWLSEDPGCTCAAVGEERKSPSSRSPTWMPTWVGSESALHCRLPPLLGRWTRAAAWLRVCLPHVRASWVISPAMPATGTGWQAPLLSLRRILILKDDRAEQITLNTREGKERKGTRTYGLPIVN